MKNYSKSLDIKKMERGKLKPQTDINSTYLAGRNGKTGCNSKKWEAKALTYCVVQG